MTREELIKIAEEMPEEFLGAYSIRLGSNGYDIQMEYDRNIVMKYAGKTAEVDRRNGFVRFVTHIGGRQFDITLT